LTLSNRAGVGAVVCVRFRRHDRPSSVSEAELRCE
jgi:hypothetical protein